LIDFSPTDEQKAIVAAVGAYFDRRLPAEEVRRRDRENIPPYDLLPELAELGLFRLPVPAQYGGLAEPWTTIALVQEELGRRAYFVASIFNRIVGFGVQSLIAYGSEAQRRELLPKLMDGRALIALALTEPEAGSDAAAARTRAAKVEGGWRLTGRKTWISDADGASHLLTLARGRARDGADLGLTVFLVPRASPGLAMTVIPKVGNNAMPSYDIAYEDVFAPDAALMGEVGRGFTHVLSTLHYSRASLAATVTGAAQAAVDLAIQHVRERVQFGRPLAALQSVRHRIADMQMRVDQSRLIVRHLAWLIAQGEAAKREASQAKVIATETLQFVADHGMQLMAGAGYHADSDMQRYWRDARLYSFGEGANEIHRDLIARELGLSGQQT
jgi:alkylation response protein AidB-like acyl-CoA dehydrogenase